MVIRGVVFDIDDTLYWERDYVRSGFTHVARTIAASASEANEIEAWLLRQFEAGVRGETFDRLLRAHRHLMTRASSEELVRAYRNHRPMIQLANSVEAVLVRLRETGLRMGVISDGPVASQQAKAAALDLDRWFDPILLTEALGPRYRKPGTLAFSTVARAWGLSARQLVYVADNPEKDFTAPVRLGWRTVRLRAPQQLRFQIEASRPEESSTAVISDLAELLVVLNEVNA